MTGQAKRHKADYDPEFDLKKSEVLEDIRLAADAMRAFGACPVKDRRAFAVWFTLKHRA